MEISSEMIISYSNAVSKYGPDSMPAKEVRHKYKNNLEFIHFADGIDRIKKLVGGSGIDYPPNS